MAQRRELGFGPRRRLHMEQPQPAKCLRSTTRGSVAVQSARCSARRREEFISAKFGAESSRPLAAPQPGHAQGSEATAIAVHSSNGPQELADIPIESHASVLVRWRSQIGVAVDFQMPDSRKKACPAERESEKGRERQYAQGEPGNREPDVPCGVGVVKAVQKNGHGGDRDEETEPAEPAAVGLVKRFRCDLEISESEHERQRRRLNARQIGFGPHAE